MKKNNLAKIFFKYFLVTAIPIIIASVFTYFSIRTIIRDNFTEYNKTIIANKSNVFDLMVNNFNVSINNLANNYDTQNLLNLYNKEEHDSPKALESGIRLNNITSNILSQNDSLDFILMSPENKELPPIIKGYLDTRINIVDLVSNHNTDAFPNWTFTYDNNKNKVVILTRKIINVNSNEYFGDIFFIFNDNIFKNYFYSDLNNEHLIYDNDNNLIYASNKNLKINELNNNNNNYLVFEELSEMTDFTIISYTPIDNIFSEISTPLIINFIIIFISIFSSLIIFAFILHKIYNPIALLIKTNKKVGEGNFNIQLKTKRKDEIGKLINSYNHLIQRLDKMIKYIADIEKEKSEQEIKALQAQIQPHFLYNTLNTIKSLVRLDKKIEANKMIINLISLLRYS